MEGMDRAKQVIRDTVAKSPVPEDPRHAENTLDWLLRLDPDADESLQLAALGHDVERAVPSRRIRRRDYPDFIDFKAAHAENSAIVLGEILADCGIPRPIVDDVRRLVRRHETGGDPRSDLLQDADSLSFFDVNLPLYGTRHDLETVRRRIEWGSRRISPGRRHFVAGFSYENPDLARMVRQAFLALDRMP